MTQRVSCVSVQRYETGILIEYSNSGAERVNRNRDTQTHRHIGGGHNAWELVFGRSKGGTHTRKTMVPRLCFDAGNIDFFSIVGTAACHMVSKKIARSLKNALFYPISVLAREMRGLFL